LSDALFDKHPEWRIGRELNKNIIKFHGCDIIDNEIYLYMEYCNQGNLHEEIYRRNSRGIKDIGRVKLYLMQTVEAIAYLHSIDIVHNGELSSISLTNRRKTSQRLDSQWASKAGRFRYSKI
jgi:hypothetical protein